MVEKFRAELRSLKEDVRDMGDLALDMLQRAVKALETRDVSAVESFDRDKKRLADQDHEIEQDCLRLIALYQPVAKDLRTIATALKMNTYLYRIGRYGKDIAILVPDLVDAPESSDCLDGIPVMADLVIGMVTDALTAFEREDLSVIDDILAREEEVDALRYDVLRESLSRMADDPEGSHGARTVS
jgi:Phosphate uptake regulator